MAIRDFATSGLAVLGVALAAALAPALSSRADTRQTDLPEACRPYQGVWIARRDQDEEVTIMIASHEIVSLEFWSAVSPVDKRVDWEGSYARVSKWETSDCDAATRPGILRLKADENWRYEVDLAHGRLELGKPETWEAAPRPRRK